MLCACASTASRDDLIRLVVAQQERIAALEAVVAEQRAGTGAAPGDGGAVDAAGWGVAPRKGRAPSFVRQRGEPGVRVFHAVETCPYGMVLTGGSVKRTRAVVEVPLTPAIVTERVYLERHCPHYRTRHTPAVDLAGQVVGKQRFGVGLVSLIAPYRA